MRISLTIFKILRLKYLTWTYGNELWGTAACKEIEALRPIILRGIINGSWYAIMEDLGKDLKIERMRK
jgi:hypothetical protein